MKTPSATPKTMKPITCVENSACPTVYNGVLRSPSGPVITASSNPPPRHVQKDPEQHAAGHGALNIATSSQHRRSEGEQRRRESNVVVDGGEHGDEESRDTTHEATDRERRGDGRIDVDAHETRGFGVLGDCANTAPHLALGDDRVHGEK